MPRKLTYICLFTMCLGVLVAICVHSFLLPTIAAAQGVSALGPESGVAVDAIDPSSTPASQPARWAKADLQPGMRRTNAALAPIDAQEWSLYTPEERVNISVYEKANRSVVNITTRTVRPDYFMQAEIAADGTGSGSVYDRLGHILTNLHVVEGARQIRVTLHNGESYEAGIVGQDPVNDIAVLKIQAPVSELHPVTLGNSDRLRVGHKDLRHWKSFRARSDDDDWYRFQFESDDPFAKRAFDEVDRAD